MNGFALYLAVMRMHIIQHVTFEGPAAISDWCNTRGLTLNKTRLYQGDTLPDAEQFDFLVILGGPMSVNDRADYPWLSDELALISNSIAAGKTMLGICLGAQMIAQSLGAAVTGNPGKEIGWFGLQRHTALSDHPLADILPENFDAFHWHGETFAIPNMAIPMARSEACVNQGFVYKDKVVALQFHLETSLGSARLLINNSRDELVKGPFIQTETKMLSQPERFEHGQKRMFQLLDYLLAHTRAR